MSVIKPYTASYALSQAKRPGGAPQASSAEPASARTSVENPSPWPASPAQQARQQLQSSLQQGLGKFMQQLRVALRPLPKRSPEVDDTQKAMLKKKVDMLLQMAQMAGRDKASLKALAAELARAVKELKQLVASMTQNAADSTMSVSVGGEAAAASAAASAESAPADGGGDVSGAAAQVQAQAAAAEDETRQAKDEAGDAAGARGDAAAANGDKNAGTAARAEGGVSSASEGKPQAGGNPVAGDRVIQDIMMKLKQLQNWLKQQTRQLQADQELRKMMKEMDKDMAGIEKMLATGEVAENGEMDVQVHVEAEAGAGVNVQA
ncbi:hypothetical protein VK98_16275 [Chromobacterium sp. LK11]|uniref:hypothetical protein n=1 Tax=Chromobacterium sp. LK11 TaxID=1628212 RepID=UPI00065418C0|nr:hypothetical protein [Chromobacterium sp. LK11]KMN79965.1 hypothetical protein VK98_16275 [Chromobacterium sp. LK11]